MFSSRFNRPNNVAVDLTRGTVITGGFKGFLVRWCDAVVFESLIAFVCNGRSSGLHCSNAHERHRNVVGTGARKRIICLSLKFRRCTARILRRRLHLRWLRLYFLDFGPWHSYSLSYETTTRVGVRSQIRVAPFFRRRWCAHMGTAGAVRACSFIAGDSIWRFGEREFFVLRGCNLRSSSTGISGNFSWKAIVYGPIWARNQGSRPCTHDFIVFVKGRILIPRSVICRLVVTAILGFTTSGIRDWKVLNAFPSHGVIWHGRKVEGFGHHADVICSQRLYLFGKLRIGGAISTRITWRLGILITCSRSGWNPSTYQGYTGNRGTCN